MADSLVSFDLVRLQSPGDAPAGGRRVTRVWVGEGTSEMSNGEAQAAVAAAAGGQSPLLTAALTLLSQNHSWARLLDSLGRSGEVSWLGFLYSVVSVVFVTMLAPALKVFLLTVVAATLRITAFYFFGEENMGKVVGSEGYLYYAKVLLGNYLGYGPVLHLLNRPHPDAPLL